MNSKELIEQIEKDPNCLGLIGGGIGEDDDMGDFWDYVYTLVQMKEILLKNGCKPPFMIISSRRTRVKCSSGNHVKPITKEVITRNRLPYEPELYVLRDDIYVSEYEFIMSRKWIDAWFIKEIVDDFDYIQLKDKEKFVFTRRELTFNGW